MYSKECREYYYKKLPDTIKKELHNELSCTSLHVVLETYLKLKEYHKLGLIEYCVLADKKVYDTKHFSRKRDTLWRQYEQLKPFLFTGVRDEKLEEIPVEFDIPHPDTILADLEDSILPDDKEDALALIFILTGKERLSNRSKEYRYLEKEDKLFQKLKNKYNL